MLEVVVMNINDALNAAKGGAGRLEIVSEPNLEGLTPDKETVQRIRDKVILPLHVMIRDRNTFENFSAEEIENMSKSVENFEKLGIQGVVSGFNKNRKVDFDSLKKVLLNKRTLSVTFHRAFDELKDQTHSLQELINCGLIDRVLTSGGRDTAINGIENLKNINSNANGRIKVIAAGSISKSNIKFVKDSTGLKEFHVGRAVRKNSNYESEINPHRVEAIARAMNN